MHFCIVLKIVGYKLQKLNTKNFFSVKCLFIHTVRTMVTNDKSAACENPNSDDE